MNEFSLTIVSSIVQWDGADGTSVHIAGPSASDLSSGYVLGFTYNFIQL